MRAMRWAGVVVVAAVSGGCLINSSREKVLEPDAPRTTVNFESEEALASFQKEVATRYPEGSEQNSSFFGVPFVVGISTTKVLSENAFYNAQVRKADADGDGTISNAEARAYRVAKAES